MPYPTTWNFELDDRATHMSLIAAVEPSELMFATPDRVDQVVASFDRTMATPTDVVALLDLAHKLLRTCVVHYEFAALAVEKSLQALELAIRIRLGADRKRSFGKLIDTLQKSGVVSAGDAELLHAGRQLRNSFAHPMTAAALPLVMTTDLLRTSHRLIASLFPDGGAPTR